MNALRAMTNNLFKLTTVYKELYMERCNIQKGYNRCNSIFSSKKEEEKM